MLVFGQIYAPVYVLCKYSRAFFALLAVSGLFVHQSGSFAQVFRRGSGTGFAFLFARGGGGSIRGNPHLKL